MKFLFKKPERKELDKDVLAKDEFFWAKDRGNIHFHPKKRNYSMKPKPSSLHKDYIKLK